MFYIDNGDNDDDDADIKQSPQNFTRIFPKILEVGFDTF